MLELLLCFVNITNCDSRNGTELRLNGHKLHIFAASNENFFL